MGPQTAEDSNDPGVVVERDRRVQALDMGTRAMFVVAAVAAYRMWSVGATSVLFAVAAAVIACGLNLLSLRSGASVTRVGNLSVATLFALLLITVSATGGFYDPNFAFLAVIPIAAALLVDLRSSVYWAAATAVTTLLFWQLTGWGVEFPNVIPESERHAEALAKRLSLLAAIVGLAGSFAVAQRRTERSLERRNRQLRLEANCVQLLQFAAVAANEADDFDSAIDTCVKRVSQTGGWRLGLVWEPTSDASGEFHWQGRSRTADSYQCPDLIAATRGHRVRPGRLALGRVLESGQPEWAGAAELAAETSPRGVAALRAGLCCALAVPVVAQGRVLRILEFFGTEEADLDPRLIEVLCDVGRQLGLVAERVRLQESVQRSQKLESVGQLAAGIAHEISNPMAYVRSNLGMLEDEWEEIHRLAKSGENPADLESRVADCKELIAESLDGVDRTVAIVRDVRDFARDGGAETDRVDIAELVQSSLRVAASARPTGAIVVAELEPGLEVDGLLTRLRQVVLNLVLNAMHAIAEGGTLRIRTVREGGDVVIRVEDNGHGILPNDRERIFEPFFTTKAVGQGTGLGLYISHEIVRWHGGTISVESTPGVGSCFTVRLPAEGPSP